MTTIPAIVFTGLSISFEDARQFLDAQYRPPVRRGDLEAIGSGSVVVIIDGVFDQELAVSPSEIGAAIRRGVSVYGAASMGALRAAEVPGVIGVGRIYELYARGVIEDDDEVAIVFNPRTLRPACEPMVNIRHAVDRLVSLGTIAPALGNKIITTAKALPYYQRTYDWILERSGVSDKLEREQLSRILGSLDLKRTDAITVLERVAQQHDCVAPCSAFDEGGAQAEKRLNPIAFENPSILLWEFGHHVELGALADFLAITGGLSDYAERIAARVPDQDLESGQSPEAELEQNRLLAQVRRAWQWATEEEVEVTLGDLGLSHAHLAGAFADGGRLRARAQAQSRARSKAWLEALKQELFLNDLAIKREAARYLSLRSLANMGRWAGKLCDKEMELARDRLLRCQDVSALDGAFDRLARWGVSRPTAEEFMGDLAYAARVTWQAPVISNAAPAHPWLTTTPKAEGSRRFCKSLEEAHAVVDALRPVLGVTRVSMIAGLGDIAIPNAQAFRPDGEWSSTVGSGKSETELGAKIGAILEEAEKWSQEQTAARHEALVSTVESYEKLVAQTEAVVDPATLDLPYDTCYSPSLPIEWYRAEDLLRGKQMLVPAAAFNHRRLRNDIYFSPRGARKTVTTNGLAAGLTMAEALTHGLCEFIERHARTLDFIRRENPGVRDFRQHPPINLNTAPPAIQALVAKVTSPGHRLVAHDIRSDIDVPTFHACIVMKDTLSRGQLFGDGLVRASGWAAHPDVQTALQMAILEASQTIISAVAGAREDLAIKARSLGRHERSDCRRASAFLAEFDPASHAVPFSSLSGFSSEDASADMFWLIDQLRNGGCESVLAMDYSAERIAPVRVVRVLVPGLETINAFHTGPRARRALLADLLPGVRL
jgi:ribosomal protein S12 methylthiotransferase accessory factor